MATATPEPALAGGAETAAWRFAVVDVETTGLDPATCRVIEVAIVEIDRTGEVFGEFTTLLDVPGDGELGASFVHGLRRADLAGAPGFADLADTIAARLAGRVVVGHVVEFDLGHLAAEFGRAGRAFPSLSGATLCTRELASAFLPRGSRSLRECCRASGIPAPAAHRALPDARAAAALLVALLDRTGNGPAARAWAGAQGLAWPDRPLEPA